MTDLKAKAMKIIEQIPDEHMDYVLRNLESLLKESKTVDYTEEELRASQAAFERLQKSFGCLEDYKEVLEKQDYRDEIAEAVFEKYASIG